MTSKITITMNFHDEIPCNIRKNYFIVLDQGVTSYKIKLSKATCEVNICDFRQWKSHMSHCVRQLPEGLSRAREVMACLHPDWSDDTHKITMLNLGHNSLRRTTINRSWNRGEWLDISPWGTGEKIFNMKKWRCEWGFAMVFSYCKGCHVEIRLNQSTEIKAKISNGF